MVVSLTDKAGNDSVAVIDPRRPFDWPATKSGTTSSGTVSFALRVRPAKRTRNLRLKVDASDPVGNSTTYAATVRLR